MADELSLDGDSIEFGGRAFTVAPRLGLMPLLKFAYVSSRGADAADEAGLAAMYELLHSVIDDDEWAAFEQHAIDTRATDDDLLGAVQGAIAVMTARPTKRPSDSSAGPSPIATNSSDGSLSLVSSIPPQINASPLDLRAQRELRPVAVAALDLIAN